jgi:hypothetical protein
VPLPSLGDYLCMAVKNQGPEKVAVSTLEAKAVQTPHKDATVGHVAVGFENRVAQEAGQH